MNLEETLTMIPQEERDRLVEYLYGEMPPEEKYVFRKSIEADPEFSGELKSFLQPHIL